MNEQQIRQIVRQEMGKTSANDQFRLSTTNNHTHDGADSLLIVAPTLTYGGYVFWDGSKYGGSLLPSGWSVRTDGTGIATVVHNLDTEFYVPTASAIQSTNAVVTTVISPFVNECTFTWFDTATQVKTNTGFDFIIVAVTNKTLGAPKYQTVG